MLRRSIIISVTIVFLFGSSTTEAYIDVNDGDKHIIDYATNACVRVDWQTPQAGTQVELVFGGSVEFLKAYNNSLAFVSGGSIGSRLEAWDNSQATVSGGSVFGVVTARSSLFTMSDGTIERYMSCDENSQVVISGGSIGSVSSDWLDVHDNSQLLIIGGTIDVTLWAYDNGQITLFGNDFAIDGIPVDYGQYSGRYRWSTLTGTLFNGEILDCYFSIYDDASIILAPKPAIEVYVDIKPVDCPNPLNVKSKSVLPVAILGTEDFDVNTIDIASVRLDGVAPVRSSYEDVGAPLADANECECTTEGPDGYLDLTLKFKTQEIVEAIGEVNHGEVLPMVLTGVLSDETPIEGADCIVIRGKHKPSNKADINKDGVVNSLDFAILAKNWLQSNTIDD